MKILNLLTYECIKLYKRKFYIIFLLVFILANVSLFYYNQYRNDSILLNNCSIYQTISNEYSKMSPDNAIQKITSLKQQYDVLHILQMNISNAQKNNSIDLEKEISELTKEFPEYVNSYYNKTYQKFSGDFDLDYIIINRIYDDIYYIATYEDFLSNIKRQADEIKTFSIFNENNFSINNIEKTDKDYENLYGINLKYDNTDGISSFVSFSITDIIAICMLFILCSILVSYEKDRDLYQIVKITRYGKIHFIMSKLLALILNSFIITMLLYGSNFALALKLYGTWNSNIFIQSIPLFKQCTFILSLNEFIVIYFILKTMILLLISLIFMFLLFYIKNTLISYGLITIIMSTNYVMYHFISANSFFNYFKYLNLFSFLDTTGLFINYQNLDFFNLPVGINLLTIIIFPILIIISVFLIFYSYLYNSQISLSPVYKLYDRLKYEFNRIWSHHNLFIYEIQKILFTNKGFLILSILAIFQYYSVLNSFIVYDKDTKVYQNYIQQWGGILTSNTLEQIKAEETYFNSIQVKQITLWRQLEDGEISHSQYDGSILQLKFYLEKLPGFERVQQQAKALKDFQQSTGVEVWLIDDSGYRRLFATETFKEDINNMLLAIIATIFLTSSIFAYDNQKKIRHLFSSCKRGTIYLNMIKFATIAILTLFVTIIVYGVQCYDVASLYGLPGLQAPIQCLQAFQNMKLHINILQYIIIQNIIRFLALLLLTLIMMFVSKLSPNVVISIIISTIITCSPIIIYIYGVHSITNLTLIPALSANMIFVWKSSSESIYAFMWPLIIIIMIVILLFYLCRTSVRFINIDKYKFSTKENSHIQR